MEEEYFVISLLSDNGDKLGINIPAQSTTVHIVLSMSLILLTDQACVHLYHLLPIRYSLFLSFSCVVCTHCELYHQSPQRVTMTDLLNKLLSNSSSDYQLCASVFPLKCLEQLCTECLNLDALRVSLPITSHRIYGLVSHPYPIYFVLLCLFSGLCGSKLCIIPRNVLP